MVLNCFISSLPILQHPPIISGDSLIQFEIDWLLNLFLPNQVLFSQLYFSPELGYTKIFLFE